MATAEWTQHGKTALAGVLAWVVATDVLGLQQPFLAPWAAVLVVHATVYRTVSRGGQQIVATFLGVLLAWGAGSAVGVGAIGMAVTLVAAFAIGRHRWLEQESATIATTGIVVLATHAIDESHLLAGRLLDTSVGVVVGLAVNLVVWPPLRDRVARTYAHQLPGELAAILVGIGEDLDEHGSSETPAAWIERCRTVDEHVDHAWTLLRQAQESSRFNLRRSQPDDLEEIAAMLRLLEEAVAETISLARTVATSAERSNVWDAEFRSRLKTQLPVTAAAFEEGDAEALEGVRDDLHALVLEQSTDALARAHWHEYGGVLVSLRNIVEAGLGLASWARRAADVPQRRTRFDLPHRQRR